MSELRGRAASPIRPGLTIKMILSGKLPLGNSEFVTEASISDLFRAYRHRIYEENLKRDRKHRLRGMTSHHFYTIFKFARYLGLVEFVRNDNRLFDYGGNLYRLEDGSGLREGPWSKEGLHIVEGNRKIYRLTPKGIADTTSWFDLCKAWREWRAAQANT